MFGTRDSMARGEWKMRTRDNTCVDVRWPYLSTLVWMNYNEGKVEGMLYVACRRMNKMNEITIQLRSEKTK